MNEIAQPIKGAYCALDRRQLAKNPSGSDTAQRFATLVDYSAEEIRPGPLWKDTKLALPDP